MAETPPLDRVPLALTPLAYMLLTQGVKTWLIRQAWIQRPTWHAATGGEIMGSSVEVRRERQRTFGTRFGTARWEG